MTSLSNNRSQETATGHPPQNDWRLERLIDRLPPRAGAAVRFLRQPSSRWLRIPAGLLLILGGVLSFLPILGIWMLAFGFALLAEDLPLLKSWRLRILDWVECRHPGWLNSGSHPHNRT
ncbi:hypothetical protein [Bradyrhizobium sp. STM 3562]|uniref:hypothetical protein n=1 Tax=Bradyrhizobium sp. STM 3562 TaxID=578924 RepID=UPI003890200F